jgi:hypothetical protein
LLKHISDREAMPMTHEDKFPDSEKTRTRTGHSGVFRGELPLPVLGVRLALE